MSRPPVDPLVRVIPAVTHGRYLVLVPGGSPPHPLLVGFHGYGTSAADMLDQMRRLPGVGRWVLASVQGLHRFYNTRTSAVVASWMTREDRELAIADNVRYVEAVVDEIRASRRIGALVVIGFSQGVAMAYRAAAHFGAQCAGVIALGGDIPPDVKDGGRELPPVLHVRGASDEWYTGELFGRDDKWLRGHATDAVALTVEGGHEWTDAFRDAAGTFLAARAGG